MDVDRSGPGGYSHCRLFSLLLRRNGDCRMFTQPTPSINCGFQKHRRLTGTALLSAFKIFPDRPVVMIATLDACYQFFHWCQENGLTLDTVSIQIFVVSVKSF
jgi:hypothetical protein